MADRKIIGWWRRPFLGGALVAALAGLAVWWLPIGDSLKRLSFDLLTVRSAGRDFPELVLIELDEPSHDELRQDRGRPWDRRLHAQLVDYLRADGARQIAFDVEFLERGDDLAATAALAKALAAHGRVVLAAQLAQIGKPGFGGTAVRQPVSELRVPGVAWGVAWDVGGDTDGVVRRHPIGRDPDASLPWVAAAMVNAPVTRGDARHDAERWVRHYGPFGTLRRVSYWQATNEAAGFYRDKTVFIGGRPGTGFAGQEGDQFRTPWSRWNGSTTSGLELTATAWLNLVRGDWLNRAPAASEGLALLLFGALLGGVVAVGPVGRGVLIAGISVAAVFGGALWLFQARDLWCAWAVAAIVQVPVAVGWRLVMSHRALRREKEWLEAPLADLFPGSTFRSDPTGRISTAIDPARSQTPAAMAAGAPPVPDYDLLRCVGRGAYGEVWLARDVLGGFRAVKIVRRVAFDDESPYEREFRGLQKFAPISREHPGLVQVLHVGLSRAGGFFYYVMEAADDEGAGSAIVPEDYSPRNLDRDIRQGAARNADGTAQLGIALGDALEFLHQRGLIHRDVKPANIIFVGGRPKLADVGLVTDLASRAHGVTQVGTAGFIPPEGAGTAAGDVFALGCLLHEALRGSEDPGEESMTALRAIIRQAHAALPEERPASAGALADALRAWRNKYLPAGPQPA